MASNLGHFESYLYSSKTGCILISMLHLVSMWSFMKKWWTRVFFLFPFWSILHVFVVNVSFFINKPWCSSRVVLIFLMIVSITLLDFHAKYQNDMTWASLGLKTFKFKFFYYWNKSHYSRVPLIFTNKTPKKRLIIVKIRENFLKLYNFVKIKGTLLYWKLL